MNFANRLDPDGAQQKLGPNLGSKTYLHSDYISANILHGNNDFFYFIFKENYLENLSLNIKQFFIKKKKKTYCHCYCRLSLKPKLQAEVFIHLICHHLSYGERRRGRWRRRVADVQDPGAQLAVTEVKHKVVHQGTVHS